MKTFVNDEMAAPNVLQVPVDVGIMKELDPMVRSKATRLRLYSQSPPWHSNVRWQSARSERDFHRFRSIFDRLRVARHVKQYLDLSAGVRLYNGFLVIRSSCAEPNFHVDWRDANNEAFTLLTPLTDNCSGFGLLYRKLDGSIGEYDYKRGEAIIFGDDFVHSTKPGTSSEPVVLLCFNFGTDKMEHWPRIEPTAAHQSLLVCRPDGQFQRLSVARRARIQLRRAARMIGLGRHQRLRGG